MEFFAGDYKVGNSSRRAAAFGDMETMK